MINAGFPFFNIEYFFHVFVASDIYSLCCVLLISATYLVSPTRLSLTPLAQ